MPFFETVFDLHHGANVLRRRRHGVICASDGCFQAVRLRPWPKLISLSEVWWQDWFLHRGAPGDCCYLYYTQPRRFPNFLALKYLVSTHGATFRTVRSTLAALDAIARIKQTDAIVCEVWNRRISDRTLQRWGWERHVPGSRRRHWIKRFYGQYAPVDATALAAGGNDRLLSCAESPSAQHPACL
jgi:hypothetical protein